MRDNNLPDVYMITSDDFDDAITLINKVEQQLKKGIRLVQLRIKNKKKDGYEFYANAVLNVCDRYSAKLVLNHSLKSFPNINCFGIHITSKELMETHDIPDEIRKKYILSCPVHNQQELIKAHELRLDFATLTPIQQSISYPDAPYIGWDEAAELIKKSDIPLYAAGGMQIGDVHKAKDLGFMGIASIGALWTS
jgi:8-oxo-dGTP diphosphatase